MSAAQPAHARGTAGRTPRHSGSHRMSHEDLRQILLTGALAVGLIAIGTVLKFYIWAANGPFSAAPVETILVHVVIGSLAGLVMAFGMVANVCLNLTMPRKSVPGRVLLAVFAMILLASYAWTVYEVVRLISHL